MCRSINRVARRLRAFLHRHELNLALSYIGFADIDELAEWLDHPPSEDGLRSRAIRNEILSRHNPEKLVEEEIERQRFWRAVGAVMGVGGRALAAAAIAGVVMAGPVQAETMVPQGVGIFGCPDLGYYKKSMDLFLPRVRYHLTY